MLARRLEALRTRLDALKAGTVPPRTLWDRARAVLGTSPEAPGDLGELEALDDELDRAGVHTSADARLLRDLGAGRGRLAALRSGLEARAVRVLGQYDAALAEAERLEPPPPEVLRRLETAHLALARVVKVALVFASGGDPPTGFELYPRRARPEGPPPAQARLAVAEFLAARALTCVEDSARRSRDLELASELVLRMSADTAQDRERLRRLRVELGAARERARAAPAVRSLEELTRHLRHAARRDPGTAWRSVQGLYERAVLAGDGELARVASEALRALLPPGRADRQVEQAEARRLLGWGQPPRLQASEALPPGGAPGHEDPVGATLARLALGLDDDRRQALAMAAGAARYFDVEDALSDEVVEARSTSTRSVPRRVPYPTPTMSYEFTGGLEEIHHFVISRPGMLLLDLAAGRQMVRAYLEEAPPPRPRTVKRTGVRVYVLDASGSMDGARARFRDAIVLAELNAIRVKAEVGLPFDPLYLTFFNDRPSELLRVDSGLEATRQMERLFQGSLAEGQTDITLALVSAFESIGQARGRDPYLARATVVLVTDGEDGVDLEGVRRARQPHQGLDIALSFISLGEENPDLKTLVLDQRQAGGRAFYHHLTDPEIALAPTEFDSAWRTLFPGDAEPGPEALEALLPHLEALEAIARSRPAPVVVRADSQFQALFPQDPPASVRSPSPALEARLGDLLDAIAEAAALAPAEQRPSEAVALLTHLLRVYGLAPARYLEVVGEPELHDRVARLRLICRPLG
jgi:hypothetical protein